MTLSIIIPIYNVEQYLRKCVDSVLNQNIRDYEIILVNDGSTDSCPAICDEYASQSPVTCNPSPLIRVIHQPNAGLSAARNSGIKVANGDYLMFVDSDDYIEPNVLKGLITQIEHDNLDVLRYRLQYVNPKYEVYNPYKSDPFKGNNYSEEPTDGVSFLNTRMSTACYAWTFVIKRELFNGCLFTPGIYFVDTDWTPRMLCKAKRVASSNTIVYNYLQREGSITKAIDKRKKKKVLDDKMRLIKSMQLQSMDLYEHKQNNNWFKKVIAELVMGVIDTLSVEFYENRDEYMNQLKNYNIYPILSNSIKARLINFSPVFAVKILHWKNS